VSQIGEWTHEGYASLNITNLEKLSMDKMLLRNTILLAGVIILIFNIRIFIFAYEGSYPPEDYLYTAVMLSLLPAAVLLIAIMLLRSSDNRMFRVMLGFLSISYGFSFVSDPWSVSYQMNLGADMMPMIIFTIIGTIFLSIGIFAFRAGGNKSD
jgi:uncharacterized membrane protein